MPTTRRRRTRNLVPGLTPYQRAWLLDADLPEPTSDDVWWGTVTRHHDFGPEHEGRLWRENRDQLLAEWLANNPGKRPSCWWIYDSPDELRRRLGGIGTAVHECLAYVPVYRCGIPTMWITSEQVDFYTRGLDHVAGRTISPNPALRPFRGVAIDPRDPLHFESQATYLQRHRLFLAGEERRLRPADFEPEVVKSEEPAPPIPGADPVEPRVRGNGYAH